MSYSTQPQAYVAVNKGRQKVHPNNKIYLRDKQEFEIELYNPSQKTVMAKISLNGVESLSGLVLKPGQRYFLDRFLDEPQKLKFDTYEVENSEETKEAIAKNGLVSIKFYNEKEKPKPFIYQPPVIQAYTYGTYNQNGLNTGIAGNNNLRGSNGNMVLNSMTFGNAYLSQSNASCTTTSSISLDSASPQPISRSMSKSIETGRVEKGNKSGQHFNEVNLDFEYFPRANYEYVLLPDSLKPLEIKDIEKNKYCSACGSGKIKSKDRYCGACGHKLP